MANGFQDSGFQNTGSFDLSATNPMLQQLMQLLTPMLQGASNQYMQFVRNPTASPLYQKQLSGLLAALAPGEAMQRQQLGDVFRGAGNMSSGIYGTAAGNLISQQGLNRQTLASQLLGQMFPQMTQALMNPMNLAASLSSILSRGSMSGQGSTTSGWENIPPSQGLMTPMASSSMASTQPQGGSSFNPYLPGAYGQGGTPLPEGYDPNWQPQPSTIFMPGGQYVSGGMNSSQLYNPNQGSYDPWQGWTPQDWANFLGE